MAAALWHKRTRYLLISGGGLSMADGARRSSRARRPAFVDRSDFVDHDAVVRHERQVERQPANDRNRERLTAQRARGEALREGAARNRCDE